MASGGDSSAGPVRPVVALVFATVGFVALLIFGLGMLSLVLDADVVEAPGLGPIPGVVATVLATAGFAGALWATLRRTGPLVPGSAPDAGAAVADDRSRPSQPSYGAALWAGLACALGYLAGLLFGAVLSGGDPAVAAAASGRIATSGFGVVIAAAGAMAGWGGIALVRTRGERPRWPWEDEFDE